MGTRSESCKLKVVFDTNVVLSAIVFRRRLDWLCAAWARGDVVPLVCRETVEELYRVLSYPKFRLGAAERNAVAGLYLPSVEMVPTPKLRLKTPCRDPNDEIYVRLALATGADCLVTGDKDLLDGQGVWGVEILTVAEFQNKVA
jgi:putative PIN family toxin of toxin-antitoxin system